MRDEPGTAPRGPLREDRTGGSLTLARAFQLMSQALSEFRSAVGHEALRLRMVAMHGREDPLLDAARFPRLLRQANDAEVADVRKVGDDDYEISPQRVGGRPSQPVAAREDATAPLGSGEAVAQTNVVPEAVLSGSRENGQRFGVRFRRGSRTPLRTGEVPLIGVVQVEQSPEAEPGPRVPSPEPSPEEKRPRQRRVVRKKATMVPAASVPDPSSETAELPPAKRRRPRTRKRAE